VPLLLERSASQVSFDTRDDLGELAVIESPDQDQAGVAQLRLRPFAREWSEVAAVACDEHTLLRGCQPQDLRIWQSLEHWIFGQCQHVMARVAQRARDPARGEVRVEQQTQLLL